MNEEALQEMQGKKKEEVICRDRPGKLHVICRDRPGKLHVICRDHNLKIFKEIFKFLKDF